MAQSGSRDGIAVGGYVEAIVTDLRTGTYREERKRFRNTATDWSFYACASWMAYQAQNNPAASGAVLPPAYIAVGTGTIGQTPAVTDTNMFMEQYDTRRAFTFSTVYNGYTAQLSLAYLATDPDGTYTDAGLWDAPTQTVDLSAAVLAGATTLPLDSGAPAVNGGTIAGQYTTAYINDGSSSEYVSIATTASAGATSWTLQSGLTYAHAIGTPVVAFVGHLFAHSAINVTKGYGQQLTIQWSIPFSN